MEKISKERERERNTHTYTQRKRDRESERNGEKERPTGVPKIFRSKFDEMPTSFWKGWDGAEGVGMDGRKVVKKAPGASSEGTS